MELNPGFIERYQLIFEKDKTTRLFAPLAEAYRKMGLTKQAKEVCEEGLKHNPGFLSGQVAYAQTLIDLEDLDKAVSILEDVTEKNHENILANLLLARALLKLKEPHRALNYFKMVLFLAPEHQEAQKQVKKLESLTAQNIDEGMFEFNPLSLFEWVDDDKSETTRDDERVEGADHDIRLDRALSLADAFSVRGDLDKATLVLEKARQFFGDIPALIKRLSVLDNQNLSVELPEITPGKKMSKKVHILEAALRRIEQNRRD